MPYDVIARRRVGYTGFKRAGRVFSSSRPTRLSDTDMTPEILTEPALIVVRVKSAAKKSVAEIE